MRGFPGIIVGVSRRSNVYIWIGTVWLWRGEPSRDFFPYSHCKIAIVFPHARLHLIYIGKCACEKESLRWIQICCKDKYRFFFLSKITLFFSDLIHHPFKGCWQLLAQPLMKWAISHRKCTYWLQKQISALTHFAAASQSRLTRFVSIGQARRACPIKCDSLRCFTLPCAFYLRTQTSEPHPSWKLFLCRLHWGGWVWLMMCTVSRVYFTK